MCLESIKEVELLFAEPDRSYSSKEASENICVAICDHLAAKHLLQTEVLTSKTALTYQYNWFTTLGSYQVLIIVSEDQVVCKTEGHGCLAKPHYALR